MIQLLNQKKHYVIETECIFVFISSLTSVVVLGTVAQLLLLPHDELRQCEPLRHLHCTVFQPLEDQVIHGVTD